MTAQPAVPGKRERLASICDSAPVAPVLRLLFRQPGVVCITHHRVTDEVLHDSDVISASPAQLRDQADWVSRSFRTLSGDEIADLVTGRGTVRAPAVAFTFDDAYEDNYEAGRMLMEDFGIAATFFVATGFIETGVIPPWDRLGYAIRHAETPVMQVPSLDGYGPWLEQTADYGRAITSLMQVYSTLPAALQEPFVAACEQAGGSRTASASPSPFMTWSQLQSLKAMGHTIGAHTHTHPVLAALGRKEQAEEIGRSKRLLEQHVGAPVDVFAYPYGKPVRSFTPLTKSLVAECGFRAAFSFYGGWNRPQGTDPYDVRRMKVDPKTTPAMFRTRVTTRGTIPV